MAMSVLGIGSGIDLNEVLNQLESVEKTRLTPIKSQQKAVNAKISGFGKLKSALTAFNSATEKLQKKDLFQSKIATSNDSYFTAKVNSQAQSGNYAVSVEQLATSHSVATTSINDKNMGLGSDSESRTVTIKQANGSELNIELSKDETSLESIANAINHAKVTNADGSTSESTMNAAVVRSGTGSYQLVITAKETGEQQTITSISSDDEQLNNIIGFDYNQKDNANMTEVCQAQDAKFTFNGIAITSASNTVKDVVAGIDITLKATTTTSENLTITADNEKAEEAIKQWVEAFNQLQSTISSLTKFTAKEANSEELDSNNGPLIGDSTLRNIDQSIRSIFAKGQAGEFSVLAQIGVNMDNNGSLTINQTQLQKVLSENSEAVAELFIGDGQNSGIANEVFAKISGFIDNDGMIDSATNGLNSTLKSLDKRYEQVNNSIEQTVERYRVQFTKLDVLISSLGSMSNYLSTQFDMMANLKK